MELFNNIDRKEIYAIVLVLLLSFGMGQFPPKSTLPDFSAAMQLQSALAGKGAQLHIQIAAALEGIYSALIGKPASSPVAIVSFLLFFPPLLLAISATLLYLALRQLEFRRSVCAFTALLFAFSLPALQFLPGVYGNTQLAAPLFALFLFLFCFSIARKSHLALAPAALFAALSSFINPAFGIAGMAVALSFAAADFSRKGATVAHFAALFILLAAATYLSPGFSQLSFAQNGLGAAFTNLPFMVAAAAPVAALFFLAGAGAEYFVLLLSALLVAGFSPLAAAMLLSLPAAEGISRASKEGISKAAKLCCALLLSFFAIFGLVFQLAGLGAALAASIMLSPVLALLVHFYGYKNQQIIPVFALAVLAASLSFSLFAPLLPNSQAYQGYFDPGMAGALSSLSSENAPKVYLLGSQDAARFYLPSAQLGSQAELAAYLSEGKALPSGSRIIVSLADLDRAEAIYPRGAPFEPFAFRANISSRGAPLALFSSPSGTILLRELDASGEIALRDGTLLDSSGTPYASAPLSRMLLLRPNASFYSQANRVIVLEEGAQLPHFMQLYSGQDAAASKISEFGKVTIYGVK